MHFGPIFQLGYLTHSIEETAHIWAQTAGVRPWTWMRGVTMAAQFDGENVDIEIDVALAYRGDMQIELIQPLGDAPSPYTGHVEAGLWGLHHLGFIVEDMDACLKNAAQHGLQHRCTIDQGGGKYCYLNGPTGWYELLQPTDGLLGLFDTIKKTGGDPDDHDIIRELQL